MNANVRLSYAALLAGSILPVSSASIGPRQDATSLVKVLTEDGMVALGSYRDSPSFLAPLTSLSPLVARAAVHRGAFEFQIGGADPNTEVSIVGLVHGADEFVVLDLSLIHISEPTRPY